MRVEILFYRQANVSEVTMSALESELKKEYYRSILIRILELQSVAIPP